jgi:hypothetical protein
MLACRDSNVYLALYTLLDLLCNLPRALESVHVECDVAFWDCDIEMINEQEEEYMVSENAKRLSLSLHTVSCLHLSKFPQLAQVRA